MMFEEDFDIIMESKGLVAQVSYMGGAMIFGMLCGSI
jgi:hypothetical protein